MCGLIAAVSRPGMAFGVAPLQAALVQMRRRGPDAEGQWADEACALGHRRLAIIDLDPRAQQPMHSACVLRDSDWASMDHSAELRTPLVDAWLLREVQPLLGAFHQFPNKRLLAEVPAKPLPEALIQRRKTGFGIPVQRWLLQRGSAAGEGDSSRGWAREVAREYERTGL